MSQKKTCPLTQTQVIDRYFLEHRAKLIDLAAFLDRVDRAQPNEDETPDFRLEAFCRALAILNDGHSERARRVLELFSDHSEEPVEAAGTKGACGAYNPAMYKKGDKE